MGMYTELVIKCDIIDELPIDVLFVLNFLFNPESEVDIYEEHMKIRSDIKLPDHEFFKSQSWVLIGNCNSYYHIPKCLNFFNGSYLFSRSDLKNYGNEIGLFIDWIDPYIDAEIGDCIGWIWYEEWNEPELIYKK